MGTIVVGVDGSETAVQALRFAIAEAWIRGDDVRAVSAWHVPPTVYGSGLVPPTVDPSAYEKLARSALDDSLEAAAAAESGVAVTPVVSRGKPAHVLCAEAEDADLLILGSRGLGGFRGLLLGSTGQQCTHHASCPVVIVPKEPGSAESAAA